MYLLQFLGGMLFAEPFMAAIRDSLADASIAFSYVATWADIALFYLGAILLAFFSYALVERPGIDLGKWVIEKCISKAPKVNAQADEQSKSAGDMISADKKQMVSPCMIVSIGPITCIVAQAFICIAPMEYRS